MELLLSSKKPTNSNTILMKVLRSKLECDAFPHNCEESCPVISDANIIPLLKGWFFE